MDEALRHHHNINPPVLIASQAFADGENVATNEKTRFEEITLEDDPEFDRMADEIINEKENILDGPPIKKRKKNNLLEKATKELERSNNIQREMADVFIDMCAVISEHFRPKESIVSGSDP